MDTPLPKTEIFPPAKSESAPGAFSAIRAKRARLDGMMACYDICNITPREIDALVDKMLAAGQPLDADMLMFSSFGERYRGHLCDITGQAADASSAADMMSVAKDQLGIAQRAEDARSVATWVTFIDFLDVIRARTLKYMGREESLA